MRQCLPTRFRYGTVYPLLTPRCLSPGKYQSPISGLSTPEWRLKLSHWPFFNAYCVDSRRVLLLLPETSLQASMKSGRKMSRCLVIPDGCIGIPTLAALFKWASLWLLCEVTPI